MMSLEPENYYCSGTNLLLLKGFLLRHYRSIHVVRCQVSLQKENMFLFLYHRYSGVRYSQRCDAYCCV